MIEKPRVFAWCSKKADKQVLPCLDNLAFSSRTVVFEAPKTSCMVAGHSSHKRPCGMPSNPGEASRRPSLQHSTTSKGAQIGSVPSFRSWWSFRDAPWDRSAPTGECSTKTPLELDPDAYPIHTIEKTRVDKLLEPGGTSWRPTREHIQDEASVAPAVQILHVDLDTERICAGMDHEQGTESSSPHHSAGCSES